VVDDESTDNSINLVRASSISNLSVFEKRAFNNLPRFKKGALMLAQQKAKGEFILQLDADCLVEPEWIERFVAEFQQTESRILCGPVKIEDEGFLLSSLQSVEYAGLNAITSAMINYDHPILANGANLAYHSSVIAESPYAGHESIPSGDDDLFVQDKGKTYGVGFVKDPRAIVTTKALNNLSALLQQRKRWASKFGYYKNKQIKRQMLLVALFYIVLSINIVGSLVYGWKLKFVIISILIKMLAEYNLLKSCSKFYQLKEIGLKLLLGQVPHLFYVVYISIFSNFTKISWKGRSI
jgi:cellulose synthase/poly-beta-1,6-N-acetylglucosamine synthase-like glycosyltransferase